jgi:hypothetical protein
MKSLSRIVQVALLTITAVVLVINARYLYTAPVANSFNWWQGDETWLMAESNHFAATGHYINPLAPGSAYSECSGLLFGSCYLTATLYGLPLILVKSHAIDTGRTITWLFGVLTIFALWIIAGRYQIGPTLRMFGCLMMTGTLCFFITSHSARSDMLVGLAVLMLAGGLPLIMEDRQYNIPVILGMLLPLSLLVNGHVLIISVLTIVYLAWEVGMFRTWKSSFRMAGSALVGFGMLFIVQEILLDSGSLLGPFSGSSDRMPIMRVLHPKADLANLDWRIFIANAWAPGLIWLSILIVLALIGARIQYKIRISQMEPIERRMLVCTLLIILPSIFLEYYEPRYFIYVLPTIILSFLIIISFLLRVLPHASRVGFIAGLSVCLAFALLRYEIDTTILGIGGEQITTANHDAVTDALSTIHASCAGVPRVYSTVTGESIAMDDSCVLITPIMFYQPMDMKVSREELWKRANIRYAIVCNPAHSLDWNETDSCISWTDRSRAKVIFERVGTFYDIGRSYASSDLRLLDTLRVYEF